MTQTHSRAREQAELAFAQTQSQFLARKRGADEPASIAEARKEKTLRLKNARVAKELEDRAKLTAALISKRAVKA